MEKIKVNLCFPELVDMRIACQVIINGIDDVPAMLSEEESAIFKRLAGKYVDAYSKHKKDVVDGMMAELDEQPDWWKKIHNSTPR